MGNVFKRQPAGDPDSAWQEQNKEIERNPLYKFAGLNKEGKLVDAYRSGGVVAVQEIARREIEPYLYNGGKGQKITKLDYIKWARSKEAQRTGSSVWETKTDDELLAEWNLKEQNSLNKISDHDACWDLNKRGGVGETPLHLLYLMDSAEHSETAKILLNMFPKLALDFYEADEYFGESSLHVAVVYGDLESVKLLVSNGAYINQRATGRFFLPEDQKNGSTKYTSYEGYAYYGEYPLAFSACFAYMDIYDYLIDNGADPNLQDSFGNTALHMAVISDQPEMYKYMVKHHKKPAKADIVNNVNLTPLGLASKLGRNRLFKEILEINSIEFWRYSNVICSAYPLTEIDSITASGEPNFNSALMIVINGEEDEHLEMLEGGVMRQLLDDKWKTFARRRFIERLILTFVHLSLISVAVYLRPATDLNSYKKPSDGVRFTAEILVCLFCIAYLFLEVIDIGSQGLIAFLKNCGHAPAHTVFLVSCLLILLCFPMRFSEKQFVEDILLILAVPGSWCSLLFFARISVSCGPFVVMMFMMIVTDLTKFAIIYGIFILGFASGWMAQHETVVTAYMFIGSYILFALSNRSVKLTGPFVTMIYKMCVGDLFRFGIIYLIFLIGFTQGFYFLFRDINQESFNTLPATIMTLFQMTLGEFKYHDFDLTRYALLTKLVFAVFMILVPILLLNMLIAMMGNTYQTVISKSEKEWRKQWAKIVVVLERGFSKKQLQRFHREYSIKLAGPSTKDGKEIEEIRALVVIKTAPKTKARIRKIAVANWKKLGHEIISQLKNQKKQGKTGPLRLQKVNKKPSIGATTGKGHDEDDDTKFTNITDQLAFVKDIDLTKGQAFIKDTKDIEKSVKPSVNGIDNTNLGSQDKKSSDSEQPHVPNGNITKSVKKYVKKPNGTPKSSPKTRHFSSNRVTPLPEDFELKSDLQSKFDSLATKDGSEGHDFDSELGPDLPKDKEGFSQFIVKPDDGYVSHASHDTSNDSKSPNGPDTVPRVGSADSKALYDQWVNEIMEATPTPASSPSKSDPSTSPGRKRHKEKKHKKEKKKDKKKDRDREGSRERSKERKERKEKSAGSKTPTSDQFLLGGESEDETKV